MIVKSTSAVSVSHDIDKVNEEVFHDEWAGSIDPHSVMVDESWEAATCPEHRWIREQLGDLRGKKVLDVGCGAGEAAVWFAKQGADVTACDISQGFLDLVHRVAALHGTSLKTAQVDADGLNMPANAFDIVYCGNLLHHVHLETALVQMKACLRPGGKLVTWDPLCHNPVINVYRKMASQVRTEDEHPLSVRDIQTFRKHFVDVKTGFFWFTTLWIFLRFYLIERVHPNEDRYWKKIIREHKRLEPIHRRYEKIDQLLLSACPFLKRYCWNMAVCATKGSNG
jgi:2-polyprenyl-3-methyl-5-hydroxy-6-metoxy-1,4-benzoquinol methylase